MIRLIQSRYVFVALLSAFAALICLSKSVPAVPPLLIVEHILIGTISCCIILQASAGLLTQTFGIFILIGYCCAPILELFTGKLYWDGTPLSIASRDATNMWILAFLVSYLLGRHLAIKLQHHRIIEYGKQHARNLNTPILVGTAIATSILVISLYHWNCIGMLFRGGALHQDLDVESKSAFLLVEFFLRPLVFNIGLALFLLNNKHRRLGLGMLLLGVLTLFPTGIPRFLATAMYLPLMLHGLAHHIHKKNDAPVRFGMLVPNTLLFGLAVAFPFLDIFRRFEPGTGYEKTVFTLSYLLSGHLDGYQMLVRALDIGQVSGGRGFLGTLLFFVPRAWWPDKPIVSGQMIAHQAHLSFENVSMTLPGEWYLNFGHAGILAGGMLTGLLLQNMDRLFMERKGYAVSIGWLVYFQSIGLLLLTLRGSLLSAFAYSTAIFLTWAFIALTGPHTGRTSAQA